MFLKTRYAGYNRHDEQVAAGYFLMLLQPQTNSLKYRPHEVNCACGKTREQHEEEDKTRVHDCPTHGIYARLKKLSELKGTPGYEEQREEMMDLWEKNKHDRHVAGCPECDAHKAYYSECRAFKVKHVHYPLRALVRYARLKQFGQFMMGTARVGQHSLTLSGSYGSDGLPMSVPDDVYEAGVELPQHLYDAWNKGGGWNGAGSEATAMREWAILTFARTKRGAAR